MLPNRHRLKISSIYRNVEYFIHTVLHFGLRCFSCLMYAADDVGFRPVGYFSYLLFHEHPTVKRPKEGSEEEKAEIKGTRKVLLSFWKGFCRQCKISVFRTICWKRSKIRLITWHILIVKEQRWHRWDGRVGEECRRTGRDIITMATDRRGQMPPQRTLRHAYRFLKIRVGFKADCCHHFSVIFSRLSRTAVCHRNG